MKTVIVLLSGGLDSTVSLWWALTKGFNVRALMFDYHQRHRKELSRAKAIARKARVPFSLIKLQLPWSTSSLSGKNKPLPRHTLEQISKLKIPSTYVPARNTIFLSYALSWADQIDADSIVIGANALDYSGYPDCRAEYLKAFEHAGSLGTRRGQEGRRITVLAPLISKSKAQIVMLGKLLKAPLHLTWSCYSGGPKPCRRCDSCLLRAKGFSEAGYPSEKFL